MKLRTRSEIVFTLTEADGQVFRWKCSNFLTYLGEAHIAARMLASPATNMSHMAIGDGSGHDKTDQTLANELARVALTGGFPAQGAGSTDSDLGRVVEDNEVIYKATFAAGTGTGTITEFAIFNSATTGVMLNYASGFTPREKSASAALTVAMALTIVGV